MTHGRLAGARLGRRKDDRVEFRFQDGGSLAIGEAVVRFVARHHLERPFLKRRRQLAEAWTAKPNLAGL
jgi:hypothetical protein